MTTLVATRSYPDGYPGKTLEPRGSTVRVWCAKVREMRGNSTKCQQPETQ